MITESEGKMAQLFNPAAPIEDLFEQISDGHDLAIAAGVPYSKSQLMSDHRQNICEPAGPFCASTPQTTPTTNSCKKCGIHRKLGGSRGPG
eukprot:14804409-Ditylum_brightwellii.AAC.1